MVGLGHVEDRRQRAESLGRVRSSCLRICCAIVVVKVGGDLTASGAGADRVAGWPLIFIAIVVD